MTPLASIIIRARDEEHSLRRLIPLLQAQRADFEYEIWLLDNDSRDASVELARQAGLCYHHIPRGAFNYSTALNQGAKLARGEFVVNLSAHCFPQDEGWLAALIQPLRDDPGIVATYGRQWTNPSVAPFEARGNDQLFPPPGRTPEVVAFSNANCAIRRAHLLEHPFNPAIRILEDHLFLLELPLELRVMYVPEAFVHHEHEAFEWRYYFRRWMREGWAYYFIADYRRLPSPFTARPWIYLPDLIRNYPVIAAVYLKRGQLREALLTLPFFYLRDITWVIGRLWAHRNRAAIAAEDKLSVEALKR